MEASKGCAIGSSPRSRCSITPKARRGRRTGPGFSTSSCGCARRAGRGTGTRLLRQRSAVRPRARRASRSVEPLRELATVSPPSDLAKRPRIIGVGGRADEAEVRARHRVRAGDHRAGGGVRLRRDAGVPGAAGGGDPRGAGEQQPRDDHDRQLVGRRGVCRAADGRGARARHRRRATGRAAGHARWADGLEPRGRAR